MAGYTKKTKEQLIKELKDIQQKNKELTASFNNNLHLRKQTEAVLNESEDRFRAFLENNDAIILLVNPVTNRIIFANDSAVEFYGWDKAELLLMTISEINILPPEEIELKLTEAIKKKQNYFVFKHRIADGSFRYVEVFQSELKFKNEITFSLIIHDITNHILAQEEIKTNELQLNQIPESEGGAIFPADFENQRILKERKLAEKALNESEERYRNLFATAHEGIWEFDSKDITTMVNDRIAEMLGYTKEEIIGKAITGFMRVEDLEDFNFKQAERRKGKSEIIERCFIRSNGSELWALVSATPIFDANGTFEGSFGMITDITDRKRIEDIIKSAELRFRLLYEQSPTAYQSLDSQGRILEVNNAWLKQFGYKYEEVIGQLFEDFLVPEHIKLLHKRFPEFLACGEVHNAEFDCKAKDGHIITIEVEGRIGYDLDGNFKQTHCVLHNITERKHTTDALRESEELYRNLVEVLPDGIYKSTKAGVFVDVNPAMVSMLGYDSKEELMAIDIKTQLYFEISDRERVKLQEKNTETGIYRMRKKDGSEIWIEDRGWLTSDKKTNVLYHEGIMRDITARRKDEAQLFKLSTAIEQSPSIISITDLKGVLEYVNPRYLEITGYSNDELIGNSTRTLNSGKQSKEVYQKLWETITSGKIWRGEFQNRKKSGELFWESVSISPISNGQGETTNYIKVAEDITNRKRYEQIQNVIYHISESVIISENLEQLIGLIQSELGTIIDTTNFYLALYDAQTDTISLPFFADEFDKQDTFKSFPADKTITRYVIHSQKSLLADIDLLKELEDSGEIGRYGADSLIWLGVPLFIKTEVIGVIVIQSYKDKNAYNESDKKMLEFISDQISIAIQRKKDEELIKESEKRFDLAMKASNDGLFDWNFTTNEIYYSTRWKSMLGYKENELPNDISTWESLSHQEEKEESLLKLRDAIEKKIDHYTVEFRMKHKLGHWVNILSRAQIIYDEESKAIRAVGTHSDLTEQKKAEQKLRNALYKAEESDRLKSAFLANMSHEIRTPMNGILGFADLLRMPGLTGDQQHEYIDIIKKSGDRMLNIINDIVDVSKIEAGLVEIVNKQSNINEQTEFVYTFFKPQAGEKGIELKCKNGLSSHEALVITDKEKVYAILTNLVKNAIKYTDKGTIELGYNLVATQHATPLLGFYVKDTGIGIPAERQQAIFDRFIQADIADTRAFQGAGLGLTISKAYVEMLGGKLWVESEAGKGSTFFFTIPYHPVHKAKTVMTTSTSIERTTDHLKKLKILIVEDDEISVMLLMVMLKTFSDKILVVDSGVEAIETCYANPDIDLVLMDIKMPVMDGYEATRQIRQFNKNVIIIAQTAYGLSGDREKSKSAGCNDYIAKPINLEELIKLIQKYFNDNQVSNKL